VKRLLLPSVMATLASLIVMQTLSLGPWAIVASTSVASTAFILFASPHIRASRAWNTLIGHVMGLAAGLATLPLAQLSGVPQALPYAVSVGLSVLLMQIARAKHPPAAGTALTVPAAFYHGGFQFGMAAVIMLTVVGLLLLQLPVKKHLPDSE
jgi:CBS-domain-containing membrane protein